MSIQAPSMPLIRLVQHLSCSGGTLICRCLAALREVALLSEVNPLSRIHTASLRFSPTDLAYLAIKGNFPQAEELSKKLFRKSIKVTNKHLQAFSKELIIRDHSHSDYLVESTHSAEGTVRGLLQQEYQLLSIITIRHPVDCYLSMLRRNWVKFTPGTFDEYCRRYLVFVEQNRPHKLFKYENFVQDPKKEMQAMCSALALVYDSDFLNRIDKIELTGDSGRRVGNKIVPRKRREFNDEFVEQAETSFHFKKICKDFDYSPDLSKQP